MTIPFDLSVALLHDGMVDKTGKLVTTSLTLIDVHDIARSSRTYGLHQFYVAHSSPIMRKLAGVVHAHWMDGFGASYNPNRQEALSLLQIVNSLDDAVCAIEKRTGKKPKLVATSAKSGRDRVSFDNMRQEIWRENVPYLLMLGTGWGMSDGLTARADAFLEPIRGEPEFNHLSVRSAAAIIFDRLVGRR